MLTDCLQGETKRHRPRPRRCSEGAHQGGGDTGGRPGFAQAHARTGHRANQVRPSQCRLLVEFSLNHNSSNREEGNGLFNDTLNIFYLRLYGVTHMVKDHSDSERGNPLLPHGLFFPVSSKCSFICIFPQTG